MLTNLRDFLTAAKARLSSGWEKKEKDLTIPIWSMTPKQLNEYLNSEMAEADVELVDKTDAP